MCPKMEQKSRRRNGREKKMSILQEQFIKSQKVQLISIKEIKCPECSVEKISKQITK